MISAIDSSIILDILIKGEQFCDVSEKALRKASIQGRLIVCECVLAEIYPAINDKELFSEFLRDWQLDFVPSSEKSAVTAGKYLTAYLQRGGIAKRVLPDFLIGSHALIHADRLLARDRGYLRDYFSELTIYDPTNNE